jgi:hypothetical protein
MRAVKLPGNRCSCADGSVDILDTTLFLCNVLEERGEGDFDYLPGMLKKAFGFHHFFRSLSYDE